MKSLAVVASISVLVCAAFVPTAASAGGWSKDRSGAKSSGSHRSSRYYRRSPKVKGYRKRRGGYSYSVTDTINTYGDSRTLNGGANSYRFELYTRQTPSGPFDHGFFFDSGIGLHGGNSPYLN